MHVRCHRHPAALQSVTAVLLGVYFGRYNTATLPEGVALGVLVRCSLL